MPAVRPQFRSGDDSSDAVSNLRPSNVSTPSPFELALFLAGLALWSMGVGFGFVWLLAIGLAYMPPDHAMLGMWVSVGLQSPLILGLVAHAFIELGCARRRHRGREAT